MPPKNNAITILYDYHFFGLRHNFRLKVLICSQMKGPKFIHIKRKNTDKRFTCFYQVAFCPLFCVSFQKSSYAKYSTSGTALLKQKSFSKAFQRLYRHDAKQIPRPIPKQIRNDFAPQKCCTAKAVQHFHYSCFFALHINWVIVPIGQYTHHERGLNSTIVISPKTVDVNITL